MAVHWQDVYMTSKQLSKVIRNVSARIPLSVTPETRIELHPSEAIELIHAIDELRRAQSETSAPPLEKMIGSGLVPDMHTYTVRLVFADRPDAERMYKWTQAYMLRPTEETDSKPTDIHGAHCNCGDVTCGADVIW